ncbi:MAG: FAD-dependent monooxygenase [Planctomycetota bacterium]
MIIEREVLVIGGGPTGSIVATLLARQGHQVLLVSAEKREGGLPVETVVPGAAATLERLGLKAIIDPAGGKNIVLEGPSRHGRCWSHSDLEIEDLAPAERGWRFLRPAFDRWLREQALTAGVEFFERTRATGNLPATGSGEVHLDQDGKSITVAASLVIAATGRNTGAPLLPVEITDRLPEMIALSAVIESTAEEAQSSLIEAVAEGWLWWLPIDEARISLALFCDPAQVKALGRDEVWNSALQAARGPARDIHSSSSRGTLATARFQQSSGQLFLAGDAISAIDPLSSQGLEKALVSAEATARAARTVLLGKADQQTMVDHRQRWERRLFRLHRQRAIDLYHVENRFSQHPFWTARQRLDNQQHSISAPLPQRLVAAPQLHHESRWVAEDDHLVARPGIRLNDSDEEAIDQIGSIPSAVLLELVGDGIELSQLHSRASRMPFFIQQSPATLTKILHEMYRLGLLIQG